MEQLAREAASEAGVQAEIVKVQDMEAIMAYPILNTPGLVINEELKFSGQLPCKEQIGTWLKEVR